MQKKLAFLLLTLTLAVIAGCGVHMEKRKHRKGFHISWNKPYRSTTANTDSRETDSHQYLLANEDIVSPQLEYIIPADNSMLKKKDQERNNTTASTSHETSKRAAVERTIRPEQEPQFKQEKQIRTAQQSKTTKHSGTLFFLSMLAIPFFALRKNRNYRLASWAATNKRKAQWGIALSTTLAFLSSYLLGRLFHFETPDLMLPAALITTGAGAGMFIFGKRNFISRIAGALLFNSGIFAGSFMLGASRETIDILSQSSFSDAGQVLLVVILFLLYLAAIYGLAILSCELACSGYGFAAVAVFFGGAYLGAFLIFLVINNFWPYDDDTKQSIAKRSALQALIPVGILLVAFLLLAII